MAGLTVSFSFLDKLNIISDIITSPLVQGLLRIAIKKFPDYIILTIRECCLKTFANFSKGDTMKSTAINAEKMSFVNFVKCFTITDP